MHEISKADNIQSRIFTIRNQQVMIDRDLAELYNIEVKRLNEQVKRNIKRFPILFRFQLNDIEKNELVANCDRFKKLKHSSINSYVFTEQGVAMLSAVLRSDTAIQVSIQIMQAFVDMKKFITINAGVFQRLETIEKRQIITDNKFEQIFNALEANEIKPKQNIFYDGQIFDAYTLIADIIRTAKKSIIVIDNYIDDTVFKQLAKRNKNVKAVIYTKTIDKIIKQDLQKHNIQYPKIELKKLITAHDRFMIIDNKVVYHFGASLKDAGKKWFAFSKLEMDAKDILEKLKGEEKA
ncbi:ORF6N domain-containing protein [bacterium]|nr:ORF6N domain-containing protein [bacterium]